MQTLPPPPPPGPATSAAGRAGVPPPPAAPVPAVTPPRRGVIAGAVHPLIEARTWKATLFHLLSLPLGIVWFTVVITGLSTGIGTLITLVGIPILLLTLLFSRVVSAVERFRSEHLLDQPIGSPFRPLGGPGSFWQQLKDVITDGAAWRAIAYALVSLFLGVIAFSVTVALWSAALAGVTYPLYGWALPNGGQGLGLSGVERAVVITMTGVVGVVVLIATPFVVRGMATLHGAIIRGLLGPSGTAVLQQRVEQLAESREASVDAAEAERRRIERDLHDGAQQRLVALAMDLGLAKERLERGRTTRRPSPSSATPTTRPSGPSRSCGSWCGASTPPSSPTAGSTPRSPRSRPAVRSPWTCRSSYPSGHPPSSRPPPTSWSARPSPTWPSTARPGRSACG